MWQQCIVIGNVGRDPDMRYTPQGVAVCDFTMAVNKVTGKGEARKEDTTWFKVTVWRERAETASQYIKKGMKLMVVGEVKASAYTNKQGQPVASLELTAHDFKFLDGANKDGSGNGRRQEEAAEEVSDIPF